MIVSTLRKLALPAIVGLALVASGATAAAAPSPNSGRIPFPITVDQTLTGICSFPVFAHVLHNSTYYTVSTMPDGSMVYKINGGDIVQYTNLDTGKSLVLSQSGPGTVTVFPDGSISADGRGPKSEVWSPAAQAAWGLYAFQFTDGHLQYTIDPSGNLVSYSLDGRAVDGCAALS